MNGHTWLFGKNNKFIVFALIPLVLSIGIAPVIPFSDAAEYSQICIGKVWIEKTNHKIACVTSSTAEKLVERGWGTLLDESEINSVPVVCTADYQPVCGVDEKTYSNMCMLKGAEVEFAHEGECEIEVVEEEIMEEEVMEEEVMENEIKMIKDEPAKSHGKILFTNVNIFDGVNDGLQRDMHVLVVGNKIQTISNQDIDNDHNAFVIDGTGLTLMPGLIDMHSHIIFNTPEGTNTFMHFDFGGAGALAAQAIRDNMLMKGITTIRDIAGNSRGIADAVEKDLLIGPRIYTSGGVLSHTGGHGDWGTKTTLDLKSEYFALVENSYIVDSPDEVTQAVRSNLRGGADFIKIMAGGGVASTYDKLEYNGASVAEMEAAVEAATDFGTYVAVHAYHDTSYDRALNAGVRSFEHGFLVTDDIVKRMAEKDDVVWSFQCFMSVTSFGDYDTMPEFFSHEQKMKALTVGEGALNAAKLMKENGVFIIGGSDMFAEFTPRIKEDITCNVDAGFTPTEALRHWTGNAGKVLKWSGPFDPYPLGELGVIKEEAYADILLWNGDPTQDINLILDEAKLNLIMKDGVIYKNTLKNN